ncbi:hypothetical protein ACUXST_001931 [Sphingomonas sp. F9_3S_D5_B_2]
MRSRPANALAIAVGLLSLGACNEQNSGNNAPRREIRVQSDEQKQLHQLDAFNVGIGLKRAIYDAGYSCKRVTDAGFVGRYKNLDEWMARCPGRDWAIFAGPDGSAQVRDCKDVPGTGLPPCVISKRPEGNFDKPE